MNPRDRFLSYCADFGFTGIKLAMADTIARYESSYQLDAVRWEREVGDYANMSYGLFQVVGKYSPFRVERLDGQLFDVWTQFEEFNEYMDVNIARYGSLRQQFKRYNGSGAAAEQYADRAMQYMEENWDSFLAERWGTVSAGSELVHPESLATTGSSYSLLLLPLLLVGTEL